MKNINCDEFDSGPEEPEFFLSFFDEKQGDYTRYLHEINRQPDKWQEQQEGQGVV